MWSSCIANVVGMRGLVAWPKFPSTIHCFLAVGQIPLAKLFCGQGVRKKVGTGLRGVHGVTVAHNRFVLTFTVSQICSLPEGPRPKRPHAIKPEVCRFFFGQSKIVCTKTVLSMRCFREPFP